LEVNIPNVLIDAKLGSLLMRIVDAIRIALEVGYLRLLYTSCMSFPPPDGANGKDKRLSPTGKNRGISVATRRKYVV
jgi:hypothetical protein